MLKERYENAIKALESLEENFQSTDLENFRRHISETISALDKIEQDTNDTKIHNDYLKEGAKFLETVSEEDFAKGIHKASKYFNESKFFEGAKGILNAKIKALPEAAQLLPNTSAAAEASPVRVTPPPHRAPPPPPPGTVGAKKLAEAAAGVPPPPRRGPPLPQARGSGSQTGAAQATLTAVERGAKALAKARGVTPESVEHIVSESLGSARSFEHTQDKDRLDDFTKGIQDLVAMLDNILKGKPITSQQVQNLRLEDAKFDSRHSESGIPKELLNKRKALLGLVIAENTKISGAKEQAEKPKDQKKDVDRKDPKEGLTASLIRILESIAKREQELISLRSQLNELALPTDESKKQMKSLLGLIDTDLEQSQKLIINTEKTLHELDTGADVKERGQDLQRLRTSITNMSVEEKYKGSVVKLTAQLALDEKKAMHGDVISDGTLKDILDRLNPGKIAAERAVEAAIADAEHKITMIAAIAAEKEAKTHPHSEEAKAKADAAITKASEAKAKADAAKTEADKAQAKLSSTDTKTAALKEATREQDKTKVSAAAAPKAPQLAKTDVKEAPKGVEADKAEIQRLRRELETASTGKAEIAGKLAAAEARVAVAERKAAEAQAAIQSQKDYTTSIFVSAGIDPRIVAVRRDSIANTTIIINDNGEIQRAAEIACNLVKELSTEKQAAGYAAAIAGALVAVQDSNLPDKLASGEKLAVAMINEFMKAESSPLPNWSNSDKSWRDRLKHRASQTTSQIAPAANVLRKGAIVPLVSLSATSIAQFLTGAAIMSTVGGACLLLAGAVTTLYVGAKAISSLKAIYEGFPDKNETSKVQTFIEQTIKNIPIEKQPEAAAALVVASMDRFVGMDKQKIIAAAMKYIDPSKREEAGAEIKKVAPGSFAQGVNWALDLNTGGKKIGNSNTGTFRR